MQVDGNASDSSPAPPEPLNVYDYFAKIDHFLEAIVEFERLVVSNVQEALARKINGGGPANDDDIFAAHTAYVSYCQNRGLSIRAARIWINVLANLVAEAEAQMQQGQQNARVHKGAPFYNVGISFFVAGNFERAYQFIAEAGVEDEKSGRGPRTTILVGGYALSEQVLIAPLTAALVPALEANYLAVSGSALNAPELRSLFTWLSSRSTDAFQALIALHRCAKLQSPPFNEATNHFQVRAVADLVVAIESSLRRWQVVPAGQQLHLRSEHMLNTNGAARAEFDAFHGAFNATWPAAADRESPQAVDWAIVEATNRIALAGSVAARVGIAAYLVVKLRNNLMHVLEGNLNIYTSAALRLSVTGIVLGMLRVSKHGDEGTLAGLV
jgi:hypothetical protein